MNTTELATIYCPYCGEQSSILVDCSIDEQNYIEDCQVCCRPIDINITIDNDGTPFVNTKSENE